MNAQASPARTAAHGIGRRTFICAAAAGGALLAAAPTLRWAQADDAAPAASGQTFAAGTYTAAARGRKGPVEVSVVFSDTRIESVEVTASLETPRIVASAAQAVGSQIVELQSLNVDTLAGATMSSSAILAAVADCVAQAGGDAEALKQGPHAEPVDEDVEIDADIVIVGSGAAGTACATACALKGARVAVFEQNGYIGGNALISGGVIQCVEAPEELRAQMTDGLRAYFEKTCEDSLAAGYPEDKVAELRQAFDDYYATGTDRVFNSVAWETMYSIVSMGTTYSPELYDLKMEFNGQNPELFDWFAKLEIPLIPMISIGGFPWPDWTLCPLGEGCDGLFLSFEGALANAGATVDVLLSTPATELLVEDGAVVGARGTCADGTRYTVKAPYTVIASGGYSGSPEMCREHDDEWGFANFDQIPTTNNYAHDGAALKMAEGVGAVLRDASPNFMMMPFANGVDFSIEAMVGASGSVPLFNLEGKRFVDETLSRNGICKALMEQPECRCFQISDATNAGVERKSPERLEQLIADRQAFRADSIEELAEQIGVDPAAFAAEVAAFNEACAAGSDEFGRVVFTGATVTEPPFYASPLTWATHITQGGLDYENGTYALLDAGGSPIAGLYGIGEAIYWGGSNMVMSSGVYLADQLF